MPPYFAAEIDPDDERMETNLPLTQARALLKDAAGALAAIGVLTVSEDELVRFAGIGPLARACAERAATVHWMMSGEDRDGRLRRALLVELSGIEALLRYLPHARLSRRDADLVAMKDRLLDLARENFADCDDDGRMIGGERLPSLTDRVNGASSPYGYAELNVFTHPTGHLHVTATDWSTGGYRQAAFLPESTIHDEGRLCEAAILPFVEALADVAVYIQVPDDPGLADWMERCAATWVEWVHYERLRLANPGCVLRRYAVVEEHDPAATSTRRPPARSPGRAVCVPPRTT
jgi:hypothetical protein